MKKYMILICFIFYLIILYYFNQILMPFIFAFLFYMMLKPIIDYFDSHALSIFMLALLYLLMMGLLIILGYYIYLKFIQYDVITLLLDIPYFNQIIIAMINMISKVPDMILSVFVFIISTFFLVIDYKNIRELLTKSMQHQLLQLFVYYKDQCQKSMIDYCRCQLILMVICFVHVCFVFLILKIPHYLFYSFMSALLDALPFIGIGIVFVPMAIYYVIHECYLKSVYVLLIFVWLSFIRNILETRMMSSQMRIPSFIMLLSMMIHLHFYGLLGIILSPIHMNILCHTMLLDTP